MYGRLTLLMLALGVAGAALAQEVEEHRRPTAPGEPQAAGAQPGGGQLSRDAIDVLAKLHRINELEIEAGTLAKQNSQTARVQRFGDQLVRDHRQADALIREFAEQRDAQLTTPTPKDGLEQERMQTQQAAVERMRTLRGAEFDREFLPAMVAGHENAIQLIQEARNQTEDDEFRSLLARLLPVLQQHRDLASRLSEEAESSPADRPEAAE